MTIYETIEKRRSVRSYEERAIGDEVLQRVLNAARLAPSASNRQEWRFVVVRDAALRRRLMEAAGNQGFVAQAPVVIACCAQTDGHIMRCGQACYPIDVATAMDHIMLAAVEEGLGTCWVGAFSESDAKAILGVPEVIRIVGLLTLGHPAAQPGPRQRKSLEQIVCHDHWSL